MTGFDSGEFLKAVANPINLQLLGLLKTKPSYPRELARLLGRDETDVSRRLRLLEKMGLVKGEWVNLYGKNIRLYSALVDEVSIDFASGNIRLKGGGVREASFMFPSFLFSEGEAPLFFVGRKKRVGGSEELQ